MEISQTSVETETTLHDGLPFISSQDVAAGNSQTAAYTIDGPEGYLIGLFAGTEFAPEFRDSNGDKLDDSTRVIIQKCDKQGNPLKGGIIANVQLGRFNYAKFRSDPDFTRSVNRDLMIDEREIAKVFVVVPKGSNGFSAAQSKLTIGDDTSDFGTPVEIIDHADLTEEESAAAKMASQAGGK